MEMKLKSRQRYVSWGGLRTDTHSRKRRRPGMPQSASQLPAEHAADATHARCEMFRRMKRINHLPRNYMSKLLIMQLFGAE